MWVHRPETGRLYSLVTDPGWVGYVSLRSLWLVGEGF